MFINYLCCFAVFPLTVGFTAIHMAAQADNVESLKLLAELIFKRHKATEDDEETAPGAIDADDASQASESVVSRSEDDSLSMTSFLGDPAELGEFLNQQANNSMTPLHIASMNNSQRVVEFLLLHRVRLDVRDSSGETALHKAGRKQLSKIYAEMRDAGASESIKNNFGETPRDLFIDNPSY